MHSIRAPRPPSCGPLAPTTTASTSRADAPTTTTVASPSAAPPPSPDNGNVNATDDLCDTQHGVAHPIQWLAPVHLASNEELVRRLRSGDDAALWEIARRRARGAWPSDPVNVNGDPSTKCPWCGSVGPNFDESPAPSDYCGHDPALIVPPSNREDAFEDYGGPAVVGDHIELSIIDRGGQLRAELLVWDSDLDPKSDAPSVAYFGPLARMTREIKRWGFDRHLVLLGMSHMGAPMSVLKRADEVLL